jgi:hypothetical protein
VCVCGGVAGGGGVEGRKEKEAKEGRTKASPLVLSAVICVHAVAYETYAVAYAVAYEAYAGAYGAHERVSSRAFSGDLFLFSFFFYRKLRTNV